MEKFIHKEFIVVYLEIYCPYCGKQHIDEKGWEKKLHTIHLCASCNQEFKVYTMGSE